MPLIDTHCHLDAKAFDVDRDATIARALAAGVETLVAIGTGDGPHDLDAGTKLATAHPFIYATSGVHPHDAAKCTPETWPFLAATLAHPKCVALGEIGLDYHYDFSPRPTQREVFTRQLDLAAQLALPIVIHTREAWPDTLDILREHGAPKHGGIFHCFSGDAAQAETVLEMGFHVSFSGIVTFPRATDIHDAARIVPDDRLLVETDAPYLAPIPHRGKRNEPAYVALTAQRLAELRNDSPQAIAQKTSHNWRRLCLRQTATNG